MEQNKLKNEKFIENAIRVHGNRYDYSKVEYVNKSTKVEIYCPKHNKTYLQLPSSHLKGYRLRCCSSEEAPKRKPKSTDEFVKEAKNIHGDEFDYSNLEYKGANLPINLVCKIHGPFSIIASSHISTKSGCPQCGEIRRLKKRSDTTEGFILKARLIHGDKYDYSKVKYINRFSKVIIICKKCGEWEQSPGNHLYGYNCPNCSPSNWGYIDDDIFIQRSKEVHNDFYDYSETKYKTSHEKVNIICPIHGLFEQVAYHHLQGGGCSKCCRSRGEIEIAKVLDYYGIFYQEQHRFQDCRYIYPLSFDFFIEFNNTRFVIEYQGEQHFYPVGFGSGNDEELFKYGQIRDSIKKEYCEANNIYLLEIPYWEINNINKYIIQGIINATTEK